jgi:hypothetical protein
LRLSRAIIVALFTWAYLRTTQDILAVQQEQLQRSRPDIKIQVDWAEYGVAAVDHANDLMDLRVLAYVLVSNKSLTTATTLRLVAAGLEGVARDDQLSSLSFWRPGTHRFLDSIIVEPGRDESINVDLLFKVPNRPTSTLGLDVNCEIRLTETYQGPLSVRFSAKPEGPDVKAGVWCYE